MICCNYLSYLGDPQMLFFAFEALNQIEKESFIQQFSSNVLRRKVLIRPDGTILFPNNETIASMEENANNIQSFSSVQALFEDLNKDD